MSSTTFSQPRRRASPVSSALRLIFFGGLVAFVLATHAPAVRALLRLAATPMAFAPTVPNAPAALVIFAISVAYLSWLMGATFFGWRMPPATGLVPVGLFAVTLLTGPLEAPPDRFQGLGPADRMLQAMIALRTEIEAGGQPPCRRAAEELEAGLRRPEVAPLGLRAHGFAVSYRVATRPDRTGPEREALEERPGTLVIACERDGAEFWITGTSLDRSGAAKMVRDGVGRIAVVKGVVP